MHATQFFWLESKQINLLLPNIPNTRHFLGLQQGEFVQQSRAS